MNHKTTKILLLVLMFCIPSALVWAQRTATYGTNYAFDTGASYWLKADQIDETHFIVAWKAGGSSSIVPIHARIGEIDPVTKLITYGTVAVIETEASYKVDVVALSTTQAVISYELDIAADVGQARAVTLNLSTNTISAVGSAVTYFNDDVNYTDLERLSDNSFVIVYRGGDATANYTGSAMIGTVSGSSLTFGPEYIFSDTAIGPCDVKLVAENRIIIGYESDGDYLDPGIAVIGDISGTTISFGPLTTFHSNPLMAATREVGIAVINETTVVIGFGDDADNDYGKCLIGTISGNTLSTGSLFSFETAQDVRDLYATHIQGNEFMLCYNGFSDASSFFVGEVSGSTITFGSEYEFLATQADDASILRMDDNTFVISFIDDVNADPGYAFVGTLSPAVSASVTASITTQTNVDCNGNSTGSLTVTASDGTANFDYMWSNGSSTSNTASTTNTISSLSAGTYTVTVTDDNGTTATASATITQPIVLDVTTYSYMDVTTNGGSDAYITLGVYGGTGPYTYVWSNSATTADLTSIPAGTYSVTVTDANSCTDTHEQIISQPAPATSTYTGTGDWSTAGNWSNGLPGTSTDVTIDGNCTVDANYEVADLTIISGRVLTINPTFTLTVGGTLTNSAGATGLYLEADATGSGNIITSSSISGTAEIFLNYDEWTYLGASISYISDVQDVFDNCYMLNMDESNAEDGASTGWVNMEAGDYMIYSYGYCVKYKTSSENDTTVKFSGILATGTINRAIYNTNQGFNLISNLYPCAIDWDIISSGLTNKTYYLWDGANDTYYSYTTGGSATGGLTQYISRNQGFFVKASSSETVSYTNSSKSGQSVTLVENSYSPDSRKGYDLLIPDLEKRSKEIRLAVSSDNQKFDETVIVIDEKFKDGFQLNADVQKLMAHHSMTPQIYSLEQGNQLCVNSVPETSSETKIPIRVLSKEKGVQTIYLKDITLDSDDQDCLLYDKDGNYLANLSTQKFYSFDANSQEVNSFYISLKRVDELKTGDIDTHSQKQDLVIGCVDQGRSEFQSFGNQYFVQY